MPAHRSYFSFSYFHFR
ncbi:hypothetical protein [Yersinia sp. KBS0713]